MLLCVAMLPHDTVLVSVPPEGALGGGDGSPAEAYSPDDMREGQPMELGARKTPLNVEEMEEKVDKMVSGLENQVRAPRVWLGARPLPCKRDGVSSRSVATAGRPASAQGCTCVRPVPRPPLASACRAWARRGRASLQSCAMDRCE
jgi:hypothetical protein